MSATDFKPELIQGGIPEIQADFSQVGILVIDHGSRKNASNQLLTELVARFRARSEYTIVEAAHMEIAAPSLASAIRSCVEQGATTVIIHPYFLAPGRHASEDIPMMAREAAAEFPDVNCIVTAPIADHILMLQVMQDRIDQALNNSDSDTE